MESLEDIIFKHKCGLESGGSICKYANLFNMNRNDFVNLISNNKKVLDLGSGNGNFAKECSIMDISTNITSVNPRLALEKSRANEKAETTKITSSEDMAKKVQGDHDKSALSAFAQGLPFKNEGFDVVLDVLGPSFYADEKNFGIVAKEMYRVTKKGGKIMIHADDINKKTYILKQLGMPFREITSESICINKP